MTAANRVVGNLFPNDGDAWSDSGRGFPPAMAAAELTAAYTKATSRQ